MPNYFNNPTQVQSAIQKGAFRPHTALTNIAMAYYQNASNYFAKAIFPICRVPLSSDSYYRFSKEDLLRDSWQRKPAYGKVMPAVVSEDMDTYNCVVDQMIMGVDLIRNTDQKRRQGPAMKDPRKEKTKVMAEQANIHQDRLFADAFFKAGVWGNEWEGVENTSPADKQFIKFSNDNSDPISFIAEQKMAMHQQTGRTPNKLAIGANVFTALRKHPAILERIKYGGTSANPAQVTRNVLAQLFEVDDLVVMMSIMNKAKAGADADMDFIGDPNGLLLAYATGSPSVEEPTAGYIFMWDMLGDGNYLPIRNYPGENGTDSEFIDGLMAYDMKKTADDLAVYCKNVV
ncbi:MAG: hypothetical protein ACI4PO_09070 [Faecousia sp.]